MKIFTRTDVISRWLELQRQSKKTIGFVPTMGGLHEGHLSLVRKSKAENDITVCSIFVNPSQFNDSADLQKYPRNHDVDLAILIDVDCEVTFLPTVLEVYPPGLDTHVDVDLDGLDMRLEGKFRPGHFDGMMEVVHRLLQITQPSKLYMGQKDFQQQLIVARMIEELKLDVELVVCPIIREADGLAMSSRNVRLLEDHRAHSKHIQAALQSFVQHKGSESISDLKMKAHKTLKDIGLRVEYLEVCNQKNLKPVSKWDDSIDLVVLTAAWAGNVRLIDNVML